MRQYWILLLLCTATWAAAWAQTEYEEDNSTADTVVRRRGQMQVRAGEKFDFYFNRGFLASPSGVDSVPYAFTSGTVNLGMSFNLVLNRKITLKLQPGVAWFRMNFDQTQGKRFPSDSANTYSMERMRSTYVELPVTVAYTWLRNENDRLIAYVEAGASVGYLIETMYKFRQPTGQPGQEFTGKIEGIPNYAQWRYGLHARIVYKFLGFTVFYRLSDVFQKNATYGRDVSLPGTRAYPQIGRFEIGLYAVL